MARLADPVQAARKAAIKREAKRNKERKEQAQEARTLRQDTTALERQIQRLESRQSLLDDEDQQELKRLQAEVANVKKIKEEYIRKHPDQRNFVRGYEDKPNSQASSSSSVKAGTSTQSHTAHSQTQVTLQSTTSRDPRWSIYYDPVFNPYGAPPPGMPYLEKSHAQLVAEGLLDAAKPPPLPEETEDFEGSDQDSDSSVDEDLKDIIMPSGPPPIRLMPRDHDALHERSQGQAGPSRGRGRGDGRIGGARGRESGHPLRSNGRLGPDHHPHSGAGTNQHLASLPARPPRGPPFRSQQLPTAAASASTGGPSASASGPPPAMPNGVVISAEPQLRDLKKEATAFLPAALRKKQQEEKARLKRGLPGRIDAAPVTEDMSSPSSEINNDKPDLLKSVQAHLSSKSTGSKADGQDTSSKEEYDRFLNEVGGLL